MSKKKNHRPRHLVDQLGMCRTSDGLNSQPIEVRPKNGKTIMPTQGWIAIADVPDEWVGQEVEWTWASEDRAKEPWCYVAGSSVLHAVRHRTNVDMSPMCRVTYHGEAADISGARLRLRIADSSGRYSLFECERSDPNGIRELLERAERESLEATVESPANGIVRGVPKLIDSFGGERKTGVHVPGTTGYNTTWLPDSWARKSVWPNGLGNVVSRVTLHLTAAQARPAVQNSEHVVVRAPAPEDYPTPGRFYELKPPIKRPARERCPDCHGLGVMHTPSWKPPRDCTTCEPPVVEKAWTVTRASRWSPGASGDPRMGFWAIEFGGEEVYRIVTQVGFRAKTLGESVRPCTFAKPTWQATAVEIEQARIDGEHCHEMAAARVLAEIRNRTAVP